MEVVSVMFKLVVGSRIEEVLCQVVPVRGWYSLGVCARSGWVRRAVFLSVSSGRC